MTFQKSFMLSNFFTQGKRNGPQSSKRSMSRGRCPWIHFRLSSLKPSGLHEEVGSSMSRGGVAIPNVGLSRSKYGKGGGDTLFLLGEGSGGG